MVEKHHNSKKLKLLGLVLLIFYGVSGGPFGLELVVQAGGPLYALLGFLLLFVWAIPEALVTAELATALPESSGSVAWVSVAFGPFWAFLDGFLSWVSGVVDNALYPVLFIDCLVHFVNVNDDTYGIKPYLTEAYPRFIMVMTITAALTYLTYRGLDIVSGLAVLLCFLSLSPFVVFCLMGVFYIKPSRWLSGPTLADGTIGTYRDVNWSVLLNTFFWNINYWESSAAFSGDVENPGVYLFHCVTVVLWYCVASTLLQCVSTTVCVCEYICVVFIAILHIYLYIKCVFICIYMYLYTI